MAKPPFDPSQPFKPVGQTREQRQRGEKPAFDPGAPYKVAGKPEERKDSSFTDDIVSGVQAVWEFFDKYTAAPTRKAIFEAQQGRNPFSGFTSQFGEDPSLAPTGKDIAEEMGIPDTSLNQGLRSYTNPKTGITVPIRPEDAPTIREAAGLGIDILADPVNLVPGAMLAKPFTMGAKGIRRAGKMLRRGEGVLEASAEAGAGARAGANIEVGPMTVEQEGQLFKIKPPESLEELRNFKPAAKGSDMIAADRLNKIVDIVPDIEAKPLKYHHAMLENPKRMKELKLKFENLPTEDAQKIAAYHQTMVNEATDKLNKTVFNLSNGNPRGLTDAGFDFIETVKGKYAAEKEALGPMFQEIRKRSTVLNPEMSQDLILNLAENSKLGKLLEQSEETGRFFLAKNTPRTGISKKEYSILSELIDDLNDGMTFSEMQRARDFLRKAIDPMNPMETAEIAKVRSLMLGQLEAMSGGLGDDVGQLFKRYAINEKSREAVEKIIGGKIESLDAMFSASPDNVLKKIFSNSNHAAIIREYIGAEKYQELVGSYLQHGVSRATDSVNGFSPYKFKTWLKSNQQFLEGNLSPDQIDRVLALTDYAVFGKKFLAEVNPSGTAASIAEMIEPQNFVQRISQKGILGGVTSEVATRAKTFTSQRKARQAVDEALSGVPTSPRGPIGEGAAKRLESAGEAVKRAVPKVKGAYTAARVQSIENKGKAKFIKKGHEKVLRAGGDKFKSLIYSEDKEVKELLMRASGLQPGSKMFNNIMRQLESKVGENE